MNILFVSSYYTPYISGLTIYAQRLAEGLVKKNNRIEVITNRHQKDLSFQEKINGVLVRRVNPLFRLSRGFVSPWLFFLFLKEIGRNQIVVLHLPMPEAFVFAPLAKIFSRKVFLIYHADLNLPTWSIFSKLIENLVFVNHSVAGLCANKIVAYSQDYANFSPFLRRFKNKVITNFPPVLMRKPDFETAHKWKEELGLSGNIIIGFAGRFAEEKGGDILIESLPFVLKSFPKAKIVFAGEINLAYEDFYRRKKDLIEKFKNHLVFLGLVPPEKMPEFFALCDVFVLPSRAECFGMVQVEAMLCGCPVVAFNIPGGRVPLSVTGMGKLVEPFNRERLAEAVIEVVKNKKQYLKSVNKVKNIFSFKRTIINYEKIFLSKN